jgi:hypothetical protein
MEGAFDLNTRIFLSLNSRLPYGDKSPQMDFFDAAFKGDLRRIRGKCSPSPTDLPVRYPSRGRAGAAGPSTGLAFCARASCPRRFAPIRMLILAAIVCSYSDVFICVLVLLSYIVVGC